MLPYPSAYHHRLPALHRPDVRGVCGCPSGTGGWCHWPRARANLAYRTGEAGGRTAARDQFAVLPPILERVAGAEHPDNLTNRTNLAHWIR